jgi:hypothetical protein
MGLGHAERNLSGILAYKTRPFRCWAGSEEECLVCSKGMVSWADRGGKQQIYYLVSGVFINCKWAP